MQTSMTFASVAALFASMVVLAAMPSVSVLVVVARSISFGFAHGALTAAGIVAADILFILLAMFGLALLAQAMGDAFDYLKYLGGAYLIVLGILLLRSGAASARAVSSNEGASLFSSFMTGLFITLADQKAILFYLGFLPAFVDLQRATLSDAAVIIAVTVVSVGGVKLIYAHLSNRVAALLVGGGSRAINIVAACVMIAVGVYLFVRA